MDEAPFDFQLDSFGTNAEDLFSMNDNAFDFVNTDWENYNFESVPELPGLSPDTSLKVYQIPYDVTQIQLPF